MAIESSRLFETVENERQRLSAILTSASDAIIGTDSAGVVLLINPAARQAFGLGEDVLGQSIAGSGFAAGAGRDHGLFS